MTGLTQFCTKCKQEVLRDGPCVRCGAPDPTYDAGTGVTTVNVAVPARAFNDPTVDCCGRDAADCDCGDEPDTAACKGCGETIETHGYADVCDECAAQGKSEPDPSDWELPSTAAVYDWAQQVDAQQKIYADVVRYDVRWHWLVLPGQHVSRVAVGGDPEMGGSTEADIPAIIAVAETGSNRNADLVVIDSITPASAS
jgi:hypothetical protein